MLYLYESTATTEDFNTHGTPINESYDEHVIREDGYYLKFKVLLDKEEKYKTIREEMIIGTDTPDGYNQFRVHDIIKTGTHVEIIAVQLHYDLNKRRVHPFAVNRASGVAVINAFVNNLKSPIHPFTISSGIQATHDFSTDDDLDNLAEGHNALEILNRICARWGAELMLNGYDIRMVQRLGKATNALLYEHKNISDFADESTISELTTRIHATSKFRPERGEGDLEAPEEVVIKATVDSPLINNYAQIYESDYSNNNITTEAELIAWAKLKYSTDNVDKPSRAIKVDTNIIDGTEIEYGDEVVLKYLIHDVDELIRCVGYDFNPINQTYFSITLGSSPKSLGSVIVDNTEKNINEMYEKLEKSIQIVHYQANRTNRVTTGPLPVPNPVEGDLWFYHPEGYPDQIVMRKYTNGEWVDIVDGLVGERIKQQISDLETEAEALADEIEASELRATDKANQALQDAKDWAENLEDGLKIHASQITAGEIETARLKVTEIVSQGLSGNEESITQLVIGDDVFKSSVTNLTQQKVADELTQEYETVASRINNVTRKEGIDNGIAVFNYSFYDFPLEHAVPFNKTINVKFFLNMSANTGQLMVLEHISSSGKVTSLMSAYLPRSKSQVTFTFEPDQTLLSSGARIRLKIFEYTNYVAYFEMWHTQEHEVPIIGQETGAISSQITQLYNMINLSILGKDGAMSRIAMGEEGIQIDGKLLHITAKTFIDNAVIKSAMIDTLDAGKITTGELNASLIRVINLDANSISGNEASFISALFSGTKSTLQITGSGVNVLDNAGRSSTELGVYGIDFYRDGKHLGALEYATNISDSGDFNGYNGITFRPQPTSYFSISYYKPVSERPSYSSTITYNRGDVVRYGSTAYRSKVSSNVGNVPFNGSAYWELHTASTRTFSVSGKTGNIYMSSLIKPSESQIYGIDLAWGTIEGRGTNVRIYNHDRSGGIQINNGDISYLSSNGWRSLNRLLT